MQLLTLNFARSRDNVVKISPRIDCWFRSMIDALRVGTSLDISFSVELVDELCCVSDTLGVDEMWTL